MFNLRTHHINVLTLTNHLTSFFFRNTDQVFTNLSSFMHFFVIVSW